MLTLKTVMTMTTATTTTMMKMKWWWVEKEATGEPLTLPLPYAKVTTYKKDGQRQERG